MKIKTTLIIMISALFINIQAQTLLDTAKNFTVKDVHGNNIELFSILDEGQYVVIDFFNTTCGSCMIYAPDAQASFEDFGCNSGNVFFLGIDKGSTNQDVHVFDSTYGIEYPSVSGNDGGGNQVHLLYEIQSTPSVIVISPDYSVSVQHIWPPDHTNLNDSIASAGGIMQSCYVGEEELSSAEKEPFEIYPNPASDYLNVSYAGLQDGKTSVSVYNFLGQEVALLPDDQVATGQTEVRISIEDLPEGPYFVALRNNQGLKETKKLIIRR